MVNAESRAKKPESGDGQDKTAAKNIEKLGKDELVEIAKDRKTDPAVLAMLSSSSKEEVRAAAAANESIETEMPERMSRDNNLEVRRTVALNPNTDLETLKRLSKDREEGVKNEAIRQIQKREAKS